MIMLIELLTYQNSQQDYPNYFPHTNILPSLHYHLILANLSILLTPEYHHQRYEYIHEYFSTLLRLGDLREGAHLSYQNNALLLKCIPMQASHFFRTNQYYNLSLNRFFSIL